MDKAVIVSAVRTAVGRLGGALKDVSAVELARLVMVEAVQRAQLTGEQIDEIFFGQVKQNSTAANIARHAALAADFSIGIPASTVHRQCGSGLEAVHSAVRSIECGSSEVVLAGGVENMSAAPFLLMKARYGYGTGNATIIDELVAGGPGSQPEDKFGYITMGLTAENLAEKYNISREEQDRFTLRSQEKALAAIKEGKFNDEVIPVPVKQGKNTLLFMTDEHPRETTLEKLAVLPPVFKQNGTVTAGNSSGRNDGAAATVVMAEKKAVEYGIKPLGKVLAQVAVGVHPAIMGIGPVPAVQKALKIAGLNLEDIGLIELNEAFAAQALAVIKELKINQEVLNVNGGAIALGHPLGCTGAKLLTTLLYEMQRRQVRYGMVTLCCGGGQGMATIVENISA